jgi:antitoxin ParD1/3/4
MNLQLDGQTEALIEQRIKNGRYRDASEVVREAIRLLDERDRRLEELRAALAIAEQQIERGDVVEWTPELAAQILHEAKSAAKAGKKPKPDVLP